MSHDELSEAIKRYADSLPIPTERTELRVGQDAEVFFCDGYLCVEASDNRYGHLGLTPEQVRALVARLQKALAEWPK